MIEIEVEIDAELPAAEVQGIAEQIDRLEEVAEMQVRAPPKAKLIDQYCRLWRFQEYSGLVLLRKQLSSADVGRVAVLMSYPKAAVEGVVIQGLLRQDARLQVAGPPTA